MTEDQEWLIATLLPHEAEVRRWLRRTIKGRYDESDIIQEAYYRIWKTADHGAIQSPRAYFFKVVRNIFLEQVRRSKIVKFSDLAESDTQNIPSEEPGAMRYLEGRSQLALVQMLVDELPSRCRNVLRLRKIDGKSQRETAALLGVTENVVEKEVARALRHLLRRLGELENDGRLAGEGPQVGAPWRRKRS
jgi:RNA polymerase sigma factor (sigma-70 family)